MMPDVFISHASEDNDSIARPLAVALIARGYDVWFDKLVLRLGDHLRERIDDGLNSCRYAVVILSPHFIVKAWTKLELEGLVARETQEGSKRILPVWHEITAEAVAKFSLILSSRLAVSTAAGIDAVVEAVSDVLGEPNSRAIHSDREQRLPQVTPNPAQKLEEAVMRAREYLMPQPLSASEAVVATIRRSFSLARVRPQLTHVIPYLASPDAAYRVVGYLAVQVANEQGLDLRSWLPELMIGFSREQREALERYETRPLWQLLVAVGDVISQRPRDPERGYLREAMHDMQTFLQHNTQVDPGGECKKQLNYLLKTLG
jgi:hypothetical protein